MHALLNLDLIPVNTNASVGDRESFFLFRGLDLHLHDAVLEQSEMEVEMGSSELHVVLLIELIVVQMESAVDRVFVHNHGIWLDKVGAEGVIVLDAVVVLVLVVVSVMTDEVLIVVLAKELAELVTELLLAADLLVLRTEFLVLASVMAVCDVRLVFGVENMLERISILVRSSTVVMIVVILFLLLSLIRVVIPWVVSASIGLSILMIDGHIWLGRGSVSVSVMVSIVW